MGKSKRRKNRLLVYVEFIPFWILFKFVRMLSLKQAYKLMRKVSGFAFMVDCRHRCRTIQHMLHAGITNDEAEAKRLARECFDQFGMLMVEIFKKDQIFKPQDINKHVNMTLTDESDWPRLDKMLKEGPLILITAHYGNWEVSSNFYTTMYKRDIVSIFRPFNNPLIGKVINSKREGDRHKSYDKSGGIRVLLKALKENKSIAILADQHAGSREGVEVKFFGHPCRAHFSPSLLHLKTGVPIVVSLTRRLDDNFNFEYLVAKPIEYKSTGDKEVDIQAVTQLYTNALEDLIKLCPEQWLWAHRRWLDINRKRPASEAPSGLEAKETA
jgi:KDO2-lipid IV(A) lauroyltransferase